jgi:hypothetical protein
MSGSIGHIGWYNATGRATHVEFSWERYAPNKQARAGEARKKTSETSFQPTQDVCWNKSVVANITRLRDLTAGWGGPHSAAIDVSLLNRIIVLLQDALAPLGNGVRPPFIVPLSNGGVQVEWHTVRGELEFELPVTGPAAIWIRDHSANNEFETEGAEAFNKFLLWAPRIAQELPDVADVQATSQTSVVEAAL